MPGLTRRIGAGSSWAKLPRSGSILSPTGSSRRASRTKFDILRAYQPFDPVSTSRLNATRSYVPTITQSAGAPTLSTLNQNASFNFAQTFQTGTSYEISVNSARDLAQKNLEAEQRKYDLGTQTIFFVLEAQTQPALAELSLVQAGIGYQRAVTAVERATGSLLERHHVQIAEVGK